MKEKELFERIDRITFQEMLLALEFGYRKCEDGKNLQAAIADFIALMKPAPKSHSRADDSGSE